MPVDGYALPDSFGMFSEDGNEKVRSALESFISKANRLAKRQGLSTPQARLDAFQNDKVRSSGEGMPYDEFFGYTDKP